MIEHTKTNTHNSTHNDAHPHNDTPRHTTVTQTAVRSWLRMRAGAATTLQKTFRGHHERCIQRGKRRFWTQVQVRREQDTTYTYIQTARAACRLQAAIDDEPSRLFSLSQYPRTC
jgi:hypothetical protein